MWRFFLLVSETHNDSEFHMNFSNTSSVIQKDGIFAGFAT